MGEGKQTHTQTNRHADTHAHRHINTMTRPGLGAGQSENIIFLNILDGVATLVAHPPR